MLTSLIVHNLQELSGHDASVGIACIYCNFKRQADQMVDHLLAGLLKGLLQGQTNVPQAVELLHQRHKSKGSRPSIIELSDTIKAITRDWSRIFLVIDALDECTGAGTRSRLLKEIASLQDHANVSFFATSRFLPQVWQEFKGQLMLEIRATDGDVKTYHGSYDRSASIRPTQQHGPREDIFGNYCRCGWHAVNSDSKLEDH